MFDAKELLNVLTGGTPGPRAEAAAAAANDALERGKQVATDAANQTAAAVSSALGKAQDRLQGTEAAAYVGKAKEIVGQNPVGTAAALGGLAAILLGTQGGRAVTGSAVKLGGLAYKALRNYQEGRPLTEGVPGLEQLTAAPSGSSFSEEAHTNESALLLVRAMVATAASDEIVDPLQRVKIVGELQDGGLDSQAAEFLDAEIQHPATIDAIAKSVGSSKELALQVSAAAHLVASSEPETRFLKDLAAALTLDPSLIAHFNQTALLHTASAH